MKSVMQSHTEVMLRDGIVWSFCTAMADLVHYVGLQSPVSEIINKLKLVYCTVAPFNILMQKLYKLQQGKTEKVVVYVTSLDVALNEAQQEYPIMLSVSKVQKHLSGLLFHGLHKHLCNSLHYLCNGMRIMYPEFVTAVQRAASEQTGRPREGV